MLRIQIFKCKVRTGVTTKRYVIALLPPLDRVVARTSHLKRSARGSPNQGPQSGKCKCKRV